ncbi:expansin EXLX1 family cellulose-binding protein [Sphaerisporangium rubeum]|uniref:Expansin (Peptidoglycan-binding protein) n=2 Tax=Sphaerisporangium rubeum TaxID=321317 RepID=A0A7X0IGI1_9ACTN|nr:expansin (peptidoglycan-binding protein) [Sphaerisporangium rubeum]
MERRHGPALRRVAWTAWVSAACTLILLGGRAGRDAACAVAAPPAGGTCSLAGASAPVAAVSSVEFAGSAACGGYLDVTGPLGTVRVQVAEECRTCALGELDMSREAFQRIAGSGTARVRVSYHAVRNPEVPRPVGFRLTPGATRDWLAVQVVDHGNPLRTLEIRDGGSWRALPRTADNHWLAPRLTGSARYAFRVTDVYGQRLTTTGIRPAPGSVQRTSRRLYSPASASPAPTPRALSARTHPRAAPQAHKRDPAPPRPAAAPAAPAAPAVRPPSSARVVPKHERPPERPAGPPADRHGAAARSDSVGEPADRRAPPRHGSLAALPTTRPFLC